MASAASSHTEVADVICEFLEVVIHFFLKSTELYPPEVFEPRRCYSVPVQWARHPDLEDYIHSAVSSLQPWIAQNVLEKIAVVAYDHGRRPVQRLVCTPHVESAFEGPAPWNEIEYAFRTCLMKLAATDLSLPCRPADCTWEIVAYSKKLPGNNSSLSHQWIPVEGAEMSDTPGIVPIRSMRTAPLKMQFYLEKPLECQHK